MLSFLFLNHVYIYTHLYATGSLNWITNYFHSSSSSSRALNIAFMDSSWGVESALIPSSLRRCNIHLRCHRDETLSQLDYCVGCCCCWIVLGVDAAVGKKQNLGQRHRKCLSFYDRRLQYSSIEYGLDQHRGRFSSDRRRCSKWRDTVDDRFLRGPNRDHVSITNRFDVV